MIEAGGTGTMAGTIAIKVDEVLRARLKAAAAMVGRSPHWLARTGVIAAIERAERGERFDAEDEAEPLPQAAQGPFVGFARDLAPQSALRARITAATRMPETECLPLLIPQAQLDPSAKARAERTARELVERLRLKEPAGRVDGLVREYALSTQEGVALMCLAEALLRIPDRPTREALIRDKISAGDWRAHVGHSPSLFVNAATWGLVVTGKLNTTNSERGLSAALTRLIGKGGEPLIRKGVEIAMRLMGEQFVTGQTIGEALANSRRMEAKGFRYSYDMLGEAAMTAADAARYLADYEQAIHAIGKAAGGRGIYEGPGISVKLSALHPRYARAQRGRVMAELLPLLKGLAVLAKRYDIGLNIDAEEADRLEISLDLLEALAFDPDLAGWNGIGFVIQAYGKRCPFVIDWLIDLARRSRRRIMVRLVKGAYWDSEIKRAQESGLEDFPVFTRKLHTDVSYLACARRLLAAPDAIFPQFATHNAQTLAAVMEMAGANYYPGQYEFQCLHGMGEPLYEEVVGEGKLGRPCRIYAPVGTHDTLLAYLVRRLLENGANTSFVNRISDPEVPVEALIADPVTEALTIEPIGAPHPKIALPRALYGADRINSAGLDLANEQRLAALAVALIGSAATAWSAAPLIGKDERAGEAIDILNPADRRDRVGGMIVASPEAIDAAFAEAEAIAPIWGATPASERAAALERAADALETRLPELVGLIVREAGRTIPNAVAEVREATDFLRYYAGEARAGFAADTHRPLGPVVAISPWNFPLAIFTGQVAAALAAGNPVLAKPAEETPLIAAEAVRILRASGVPAAAVQLLPGAGDVGAALVADPRVRGVLFTGSTDVARAINRSLSSRLTPDGRTLPLIAETGGQNAMIVDSSALAEQVAADAILSAFDSAGQRCSALQVLCIQDDVADWMLAMLKGAMAELSLGDPALLSTDIGPVITQEAAEKLEAHIAAMAARGFKVHRLPAGDEARPGSFLAPALIEIEAIEDVPGEVFGPVLHVLRYARDSLDLLVDAINGTGYGLTFGLHTRIDETIAAVTARVHAGNLYVNRNVVGAVVGVQPFGGNGLSGTGPKAGGPLYLGRLVQPHEAAGGNALSGGADPVALAFADWLARRGDGDAAAQVRGFIGRAGLGAERVLAGPVGQRDSYFTRPRGRVLIEAQTPAGLTAALGAALATGNRPVLSPGEAIAALLGSLPTEIARRIDVIEEAETMPLGAVLYEGDADRLALLAERMAARDGPIVAIHAVSSDGLASGRETFYLDGLVEEVSLSINTAAAGGNASLMSIG